MIKVLRKLGIEGIYLNIVKAIYDKTIDNIILRQGCTQPPVLFYAVQEFLARPIKREA
jgi:hypothetical protein